MAKRDKERLIPREVTKAFIKEHNIKSIPDIQNALKELFGETLQELLEAEMDHNLGYEKNDNENKQTENRRNGHSPKTVRSESEKSNSRFLGIGKVNSTRLSSRKTKRTSLGLKTKL